MTITSIGDLAANFQLRHDTARIKQDLTRITAELSSGVKADVVDHLGGDFGYLAGIEQGIARLSSYRAITEEHSLVIASQQQSLGKLREFGEISTTFLSLPDAANRTLIRNAGAEALANFASALSTLNTQVGGRIVFSGVATNLPAVADSETILASVEAELLVAGAASAQDVVTVVNDWFAAGGAYETVGYIGGAASTTDVVLSDYEVSDPPVTAEDDAIRRQLASLALGALLGRDVLAGDLDAQGDLARLTGESLLASGEDLIALQAQLGGVEAQIERASVEISAEADALALAKAQLIEVDPYDAASELQTAESQLQMIYAITARLSRLSLVEYL